MFLESADSPNFIPPPPLPPAAEEKVLAIDPQAESIKENCLDIRFNRPPTQDEINSILKRLYFDTSIIRHIRRIGDEAEGWEYGDYEWVYRHYRNNPELTADIKALCYIVALVDEWGLEICSSNASYSVGSSNKSRICPPLPTGTRINGFQQVAPSSTLLRAIGST